MFIVEGGFYALHVLVIFVAFASYQHDIIGAGQGDGGPDSGPAVFDDLDFGGIGRGYAGPHLGQDSGRVFEPGVVGREDDGFGVTGGEGGHQGAFGGIAVAAAAYYRDEALLGAADFGMVFSTFSSASGVWA